MHDGDMKCRWCDYAVPQYVRISGGRQRAGLRMLYEHLLRNHRDDARRAGVNLRVFSRGRADDCCPACGGRGCGHCEPNGPQLFDGNTGERLRAQSEPL